MSAEDADVARKFDPSMLGQILEVTLIHSRHTGLNYYSPHWLEGEGTVSVLSQSSDPSGIESANVCVTEDDARTDRNIDRDRTAPVVNPESETNHG